MSRTVEWSPEAKKHLKRLDRPTRERIREAVYRLAETGHGDVVKLHEPETGFRLRVGDWRVRFEHAADKDAIMVQAVLPRGDDYKRR
jgi:mRNA-degrading endonuclease RelE of RelBE toxin-antitoxin system